MENTPKVNALPPCYTTIILVDLSTKPMINIFALSSLLNCIIIIFLGNFVFYANTKSQINRLFSLLCFFLALWAFSEFMYRQSSNPENALLWIKISTIFWTFSAVSSLHFATVFSNHKFKQGYYFLTYLPATAFSIIGIFSNLIYTGAIKEYWGYTYQVPNNFIYWFSNLWSASIAFFAAGLCFLYFLKQAEKTKRIQAEYIAIGLFFPILSAFITEITLPAAGIRVPELSTTANALFALLIGYAIWRYRLFIVNPATAADNIISTMNDSLVLFDLNGTILTVNNATKNLLEYDPRELAREPINILFENKETGDTIINKMKKDDSLQNFQTNTITKEGIAIPVIFSASKIKDNNEPVGVVGIIKDIATIKEAEEVLKRSHENLKMALESTVNILATTIEKRDPYTAGHQERVAILSVAIAKEMGLKKDKTEGIKVCALLHDIGKIAVPIEILSKPGKITKEEYDILKTHSKIGYEILKDMNFPWPVAQATYEHLERVDGSGYPNGLKGDEIIIEARIIAVADVVEAMSSHRPYRPSLGIDAALAEITENKGRLYDPQVVEACVKLFKEKKFHFDKNES